MREPSTPAQRWAWWEAAVAGEQPPVHEDEPHEGFYAVRLFRYADWPRGPFVPARLWWEPGEIDPETGELLTDERPCAEINGKRVDAWTSWTLLARRPISEAEWNWLRAMAPLLPKSIPRKLRHSA